MLELDETMGNIKFFKMAMEKAKFSAPWMKKKECTSQQWNPYSFEGGTTAAIAGENFAIVGGDSRLTQSEVNILSRGADKIHLLNDSIILSSAGFCGDILQLRRLLQARLHKYRFDYRGDMTVDLCAELLSRNLYYRRFFPYYTESILSGIDENGKGAVFSYDSLGMLSPSPYAASGPGEPLIMPFFDCQISHVTLSDEVEKPILSIERAISLMKDAFRMVTEREISTGDKMHLVIAEHDKPIRKLIVPLRED